MSAGLRENVIISNAILRKYGNNMLNSKLESCSKEVQLGIKWLEEEIKTKGLSEGYSCSDAEIFYVLMKVDSPLLNEFLLAAENETFWDEGSLSNDSHLLWYLAKIGLGSNKYFCEFLDYYIKDGQTVKGFIHSNDYKHVGPLRVLLYLEPNSESTRLAIKFLLENLQDYTDYNTIFEYKDLALGILVLSELDFYKYKDLLEKLCTDLIKLQGKDGSWGSGIFTNVGEFKIIYKIMTMSLIPAAISRVFGKSDSSVKKCTDWLKKIQEENGSWENRANITASAILTLICAGEGPKISLEEYENEIMLNKQNGNKTQCHFISTLPPETQIKDKIKNMLNNASSRVLICSRFITEFWADIVKLKNDNPNIDIRILTVPKNDSKQYKGAGKKFIEPAFDGLQRTLEGNFRTNTLLHSRLYIIDNEVLVSSADITPEQLEKEYNVGIWTKDETTLNEAIEFFENIWKDSTN